MGGKKRPDSTDRPPLAEGDDSGLVVSFAVGPSGVGPVMGFGSDDFFPVAPVADAGTDHRSVGTREVGGSQAADHPADVVASPVNEPVRGANARRGS